MKHGLFTATLWRQKARGGQSSSREKRRWSFSSRSSFKQPTPPPQPHSHPQPSKRDASYGSNLDANKHAIAVAAATAAVTEAALAAAHAAAEVVRLTNTGGRGGVASPAAHVSQQRWQHELAAVKIQSTFRGYQARRALQALKALVKLQALVRDHIVTKLTADMLKRMQTLFKVQARVRASRTHLSESLRSSSKSSLSRRNVPGIPDKSEHHLHAHISTFDGPSNLKRCGSNSHFRGIIDLERSRLGSNWLDHWMEESVWTNHRVSQLKCGHAADDEESDKILEVDTWKPHLNSQHCRAFRTSQRGSAVDCNNHGYTTIDSPSKFSVKSMNPLPSESSGEILSLSSLKFSVGRGETALGTADNSPQVSSAWNRPGSSARRGPSTPSKSEFAWGYISGYSGYPNYMANTESSRAKVRSQSAPRQRLEFVSLRHPPAKPGIIPAKPAVHPRSPATSREARGPLAKLGVLSREFGDLREPGDLSRDTRRPPANPRPPGNLGDVLPRIPHPPASPLTLAAVGLLPPLCAC